MAYDLTLRQVRESSIRNVAGACVGSLDFVQMVNEVTRRLMRRGSWFNSDAILRVCTQGCDIVWPRQVSAVLGVRFCCGGEVPLRNKWWAIAGWRSCNGWRGDAVVRETDLRPCYNEIAGNDGRYVKLHIVKIQDVGKKVRIFGFQLGNQPLQELDANGNWVPGITITATQAGAQTTVLVTKITSVIKEESQGRFFLYEVHPTTGDLRDLAMYEYDETSPAYRCSRINGINSLGFKTDSYGRHIRQMEALVKLAFIPVAEDDDFVMLSNIEALKFGIQAFKLAEANEDDLAEAKLLLAIRELNFELRDREPAMQTTIMVNSISSNCCITNPI